MQLLDLITGIYTVHLVYGAQIPYNIWHTRARSLGQAPIKLPSQKVLIPITKAGLITWAVIVDDSLTESGTREERQWPGFGTIAMCRPIWGSINNVMPGQFVELDVTIAQGN